MAALIEESYLSAGSFRPNYLQHRQKACFPGLGLGAILGKNGVCPRHLRWEALKSRAHELSSPYDGFNGLGKIFRDFPLQNIAVGRVPQNRLHRLRVSVSCDEHDLRSGRSLANSIRRLDSVQLRETEVQQNQIGLQFLGFPN